MDEPIRRATIVIRLEQPCEIQKEENDDPDPDLQYTSLMMLKGDEVTELEKTFGREDEGFIWDAVLEDAGLDWAMHGLTGCSGCGFPITVLVRKELATISDWE